MFGIRAGRAFDGDRVDAHVHLCADGTDGTLDRIGEPSQDRIMAVIELQPRLQRLALTQQC